MLTIRQIADALSKRLNKGDCFQECYDAITLNLVRPVGENWCGQGRAITALGTWRIRQWTTREGGIPTLGFETTLQNLAALPPDEQILQCNLDAPDRVFILFIGSASQEVLGCLRVMRRLGAGLDEFADTP
jgi:hypothetical protein